MRHICFYSFPDPCDQYEDDLTESDARELFLNSYNDLHSHTATEWETAMESEPFSYLGDKVRRHTAFKCVDYKKKTNENAGTIIQYPSWNTLLACAWLPFLTAVANHANN